MILAEAADGPGLAVLGLRFGDEVRWRATTGGRWLSGTVARREKDGSIGVVDGRGAARSLPLERLEVRCVGRRRGVAWESLVDRAGRCEQLCLLDPYA